MSKNRDMKNLRKVFLLMTIFIAALTGLRLFWVMVVTPPDQAQAVQGQLDLRQWDLSADHAISLNGEWDFYPQQLLTGTENADLAEKMIKTTIQVPGRWDHLMKDKQNPKFGYGSYRLRVLVDAEGEQIYGLRLPTIPTSSKVYINGQLLAQSGDPGPSFGQYQPRIVPFSATFASNEKEIDIIVQVANFNDRIAGGIYWPIKFGSDHAVNRSTWFSAGLQLSVCLLLLGHAIYSIILYCMGVRQKALIYFFLLLIFGMISILIDNSFLLLVWLPISYAWNLKLYYLVYLGLAVCLFHYAKHLLSDYKSFWGLRTYSTLCIIYAAAVIVLPVSWLAYTDIIHAALVLIPFLAVPVLSLLSAARGDRDVIFILLGLSGIMVNILWGVVKNTGWMEMDYYPFDMMASFIAFASYWFSRYMRNSAETKQLAKKLIEEDKLKDQFLVQTSHELRNPLHGMLSLAQTVLDTEGKVDDAKNREQIQLLVSVGKRMSFLLNDLLDINRLREKRIHLKLTNVQVQATVSGVLGMIDYMIKGKPVQLVNRIPDSFPPVRADEDRLVQILFNLLHNAAKFTNEGTIIIDAYVQKGKAVISVADTGIGISEQLQQMIFDPYEQGDAGDAVNVNGLGLGLSISKQLVELHEGELSVSAVPGQGSVFSFTLPQGEMTLQSEPSAYANAWAGAALESAAANAKSNVLPMDKPSLDLVAERPRILAVDDDSINLDILVSVLSLDQYDIVTATSGAEAVAMLTTREWDLVIADVMMPQMSGYELSYAIRERFTLSELPILLLTARSRAEDIDTGFKAGANDYLTKPVDVQELKSRVRALTDSKKSFRERLRVEAAWLQAQIQPHFLFNTLNSISALSEIDIIKMRSLLDVFGKYLRASFSSRNLERFVSLRHELGLVHSYLHIEKARFEERIQIIWEADEDLQLDIPPLSIQPLVENAIKHGILARAEGGTIRIRVIDYEGFAEITIEDDGVGMDADQLRQLLEGQPKEGHGIGLRNTDRRLKQLYGQGLQIRSEPGKGTAISFIVKK
ncbi:ATP-binding protein [Paenibacillus paridis]|uniref:hybrid sensor histidine kinase/response regulator n=1 Tax=Paenibacillus paridis TaxID=2583376 RepID=UPI001EE40F34|nr:ATP-binding protein [Paenibacillus paridis]